MKIFLGSDHAGFEKKEEVKEYLQKKGYDDVTDVGCNSHDSCDYPVYGARVAREVVGEKGSLGIILCGSGIGISIAANKIKGARAAHCNSIELAKLAREHNGANILAVGGRTKLYDDLFEIIETFLITHPDMADRHQRRREQLDSL
ncbi:RpiB/LacA/LacB family sugar-phosphate isomerase [Candidatus Gracilibacteria bacterium]|nr:RpiB/LacA/LacB family sugar-phosphate isomerase [Candidatus Gracilibacteria bacterium]MCF7819809.1 RpiB/LacA/LacB family sugar-phosphate isomerase [Candidatus Gracilibacteria bacterium]